MSNPAKIKKLNDYKLSIEQLNNLIKHAIKYNLDHIQYETENS